MQKGQAEALFPLLEDVLKGVWDWQEIDAIGVGIGPGNFTGTRIAVSAARGLGLSLGIPVFGVSTFEIVRGWPGGRKLISLPAPRDQAYVQGFVNADPIGPPRLIDPAHTPTDLQLSFGMEVHGHRATDIAKEFDAKGFDKEAEPDPGLMAEMAEDRYLTAKAWPAPPAPLYVRPPDAAPASDPPPVILP